MNRAHTRMNTNRAVRSKPKRGHCALLVVPSSLMAQWKQELLKARRRASFTCLIIFARMPFSFSFCVPT